MGGHRRRSVSWKKICQRGREVTAAERGFPRTRSVTLILVADGEPDSGQLSAGSERLGSAWNPTGLVRRHADRGQG